MTKSSVLFTGIREIKIHGASENILFYVCMGACIKCMGQNSCHNLNLRPLNILNVRIRFKIWMR